VVYVHIVYPDTSQKGQQMDWMVQQELEIEFWSRYDYVSEAYGAEARQLAEMARLETQWDFEAFCIEEQDRIETCGPTFSLPADDTIPF
jgi:hypothetical protein